MTERNIHWRSIVGSDTVVDYGSHWEVLNALGVNKGVVYWEGKESTEAQKFLRGRAIQHDNFVGILPPTDNPQA